MRRDEPPLPDAVLATWRHTPRGLSPVTIFPDGCRDLIVLRRAGERARWFVSPLMDGVQHSACRPGEVWLGFRFKPGVVLQESVLVSAVSELDAEDPVQLVDAVRPGRRRRRRSVQPTGVRSSTKKPSGSAT